MIFARTKAAQGFLGQEFEKRRAQKTYLELVEDPAHARHPLAARAYRRLGDISWRAKKSREALEYWRSVITEEYKAIACDAFFDVHGVIGCSVQEMDAAIEKDAKG